MICFTNMLHKIWSIHRIFGNNEYCLVGHSTETALLKVVNDLFLFSFFFAFDLFVFPNSMFTPFLYERAMCSLEK